MKIILFLLLTSFTTGSMASVFHGSGLGDIPDAMDDCDYAGDPLEITFEVQGIDHVESVSVEMAIEHQDLGDVVVLLLAPDGTSHVLFGSTGASQGECDGYDVPLNGVYQFHDHPPQEALTWWQQAVLLDQSDEAMPSGTYRSSVLGALPTGGDLTSMNDAFDNVVDANGQWKLVIFDTWTNHVGSVTAATLTINAGIIKLSELDGSNGFAIHGVAVNDLSGASVSHAGDVNGDGIDDLIVGAPYGDANGHSNAGSSYVVFGSDQGFPNPLPLADLDGSNGFAIHGVAAEDWSGGSVSHAGDVNGDGVDDLIIGADGVDANGHEDAGSSYVVFGNAQGFPNPLPLAALDGSNGFAIHGVAANDWSGFSVNHAGDVNGDGLDDLIIGALYADANDNGNAGISYVVFGSSQGFPNPLQLFALNGSSGFAIHGIAELDQSGISVSHAGDVNGDGLDDLIIGAYQADANGNSEAGSSYVVFGSDQGFPNPLPLAALDGSNGFAIHGEAAGDRSGWSVSHAGDVNGDGLDDLIIGALLADINGHIDAGSSYVVFGSDQGFPNPLPLATLDGSNGFAIHGIAAVDWSGASVSHAGDVNGDGLDDLIIGAYRADPNGHSNAGSSYVVFGSAQGFPNPLPLAALNGSNGFAIHGGAAHDLSGYSLSHAGDVNDDGIDDLIIGAYQADANGHSNAGNSYVVFGDDLIFSDGF